MRVYISGPISGVTNGNRQAFSTAKQMLADMGFVPVSPQDIEPKELWSDYMREDIKLLCDCEAIYMLEGWTHSAGARLELHIAATLGITVLRIGAPA